MTETAHNVPTIYKAQLGVTATLISIFSTLLLGAVLIFFLFRALATTATFERIVSLAVTCGISILYILVYLYRPVHYVLDGEHLIIKRPLKDVKIPMNEIKDAFIVKKDSMMWTERAGGNGGLFGFYGNFKNNLGLMTWYATKLKNYVMIETIHSERIILTPDDTDMVKEIRKYIGR